MTFDPSRIRFEDLLDAYWHGQPTNIPPGPDGRVDLAIITRGARQREIAEASKARQREASGETVYVDVLPDAAFWPAERVHQKFDLQRSRGDLVHELAAGYPDLDAFLASTAAARLNAYLDGYRDPALLEDAARELGWDVEVLRERLEEP